jgi:hypothetical protein
MIRLAGRFSMLNVAATLAAVMILIGTGWAAAKIYEKFFTKVSMTLEQSPMRESKLPDGRNLYTGVWTGTALPDDPKALETAKRRHEEMKQLLAQKKYDFIKAYEFEGRKQYVYKFTLADGSHTGMNFSMPLDNVVSWEDYKQKEEQNEKQRQEQINKALAAGRFRLIDVDLMLLHICREVATNQKYRIQRIPIPDLKERSLHRQIALYRSFDIGAEEKTTTMPQTSWQDHLDAVRDGKWELLSEETISTYQYEVVLDDGSKTIFRYGGGKPLEKPIAK